MERERKFRLTRLPRGLRKCPHRRIQQGYLAVVGARRPGRAIEVRIRDEDGRHTLTVKGGKGGRRTEIEITITRTTFRSLWPLTAGKRLAKVRYRVPLGNLTVEVDVYRGELRGLLTAEVEFDSDRQYRNFQPPEWLGREVTGEDRFSNSRLATRAPHTSFR
jgi:adenylate cyclase